MGQCPSNMFGHSKNNGESDETINHINITPKNAQNPVKNQTVNSLSMGTSVRNSPKKNFVEVSSKIQSLQNEFNLLQADKEKLLKQNQ